ncbi:glycerophosphoryl diester phosphodiesterase [Arcicella aurantiaca]|uniref:Glycerophosphoryl diester phosphodiesterase n=1 Tax=Arcicella aurantiaca TaxID=591202 RepID=A0A316DUW0_9BACT|nr:glycerophosphodiester phosphodiesterase [Arcicella aurantiaca]PWK21871.1 glycerophosphoryl diester phosphodiesterase [Arcicella aurantiaca]
MKEYKFYKTFKNTDAGSVQNATCVILLILIAFLSSCNDYDLPETVNITPPISDGQSLSAISKQKLEGIYKVTKGRAVFGDTLILKWNNQNNLSIFGGINGLYAVTKGVKKDSSIYVYGYWRYALNSETGGFNLQLNPSDGSNVILSQNQARVPNLIIKGSYGFGNNSAKEEFEMVYVRPFSKKVLKDDFKILAHRSGGRTSDLLSISENTLEMIGFTENFGSTGIEIDVRLTKDNVPVLYHDEDINIRLTKKSPFNGPIADYTFAEISRFIRLVNGEKIPTLEDALLKVVDSTSLNVVWLDMKSVNNAMAKVIPIQQKMLERAKQKNRDLSIYIGLPEQQVLDFFKTYPNYQTVPSLCELTVDDVTNINAQVWAPRWTLGLLTPEVNTMHAQNRKVFCWTLDNEAFIKKYVREGDFDGILTNYPTIVAYYHYLR